LSVPQHSDVKLSSVDELFRESRIVQLLADVVHPLHQGDGIVHQRLPPDAERGVRTKRLDEERHPEVPAGLERLLPGEHRESGIEDVFEGQELLGESLVLTEVELARAAAGVLEAEQVEQPGDGDVAKDVVAKHLHQIEDQIRPPAGETGSEPLNVSVRTEN
jgi:hypothetical protein